MFRTSRFGDRRAVGLLDDLTDSWPSETAPLSSATWYRIVATPLTDPCGERDQVAPAATAVPSSGAVDDTTLGRVRTVGILVVAGHVD